MRPPSLLLLYCYAVCSSAVGLSYDPGLSLASVWFTAASYCSDRGALQNWTCKTCRPDTPLSHIEVLWNPQSAVQGVAGYDPLSKRIVVAFRGSVGTENWLEDFDFALVPTLPALGACPNCTVSKGFQTDTFLTIWPQCEAAIAAIQASVGAQAPLPILLTGHSLGAAIAEVAARALLEKNFPLAAVYTFGTPRVGDPSWASAWSNALQGTPAFRVTHFMDPVPHLPLEAMGFQHPPTEVFYSSESGNGWRQCSSTNGEDKACSDGNLPLDPSDHNHYLGVYIDGCNP